MLRALENLVQLGNLILLKLEQLAELLDNLEVQTYVVEHLDHRLGRVDFVGLLFG